jgi:hypothetical protein
LYKGFWQLHIDIRIREYEGEQIADRESGDNEDRPHVQHGKSQRQGVLPDECILINEDFQIEQTSEEC